ncbi:tetratricopeptide repeat protein [Arthrospira platensis NCB002]|uniref:tetratricopeptide repeat protein n=1 Tax=Limnospira platensis TaxID=118562 RepID=UPI0001D0F03B|nr:tetratricopeptide repeat protein [Arthrospira platensis NCB002]BAI87903.1 TPR domain protein [Arthrospira platensis NIES-39]BDT10338.1 TPR domain protein [Arthrospira platensis NIES-39]
MKASDFSQGNQLLRSNQLEEAVAAYQKAIAHDPSFHWYHQKLGESLEKLGRLEEAAEAYRQAVERHSNKACYHWDMGRVLRTLGRDEEAVQVEETATEIEEKLSERRSLFNIYLASQNQGSKNISSHQDNETPQSSYWSRRENSHYLREIRYIINLIGSHANSIIDVGSNGCPYLDWFSWIPERYSIDLRNPYQAPGVVDIKADFLKYNPDKKFDILTCLQVIEHVRNARAFCQKLLKTGRVLVVSVPYQWRAGRTKGHIHDPVDLEKMNHWFGREPNYYQFITEPGSPLRRLICVYDVESNLKSDQLKMLCKSKEISMVSKLEEGNLLQRMNKLGEAVEVYREAIQENSSFYWVYQKLGETLSKLGRLYEAEEAFRKGISVNPDAGWLHLSLGRILAKQHRWEQAIASYRQAVKLGLDQPTVLYELEQALAADQQKPVFYQHTEIKIYRADDMRYTPFYARENCDFLKLEKFEFTNSPEEADLFLSRHLKNLYPYIKNYGKLKKYLVWTHEPRYNTHFFDKIYIFTNVEVHIMNTYTNNIYVNNYKYFNLPIMNPVNLSEFDRLKGKLVVIIATCKQAVPLIKDGVDLDLIKIRNNIAYVGFDLGKVDIYGPGWKSGVAVEDSRKIARQQAQSQYLRKIEQLRQYHFNLCFESTIYPYYCTEKIWHSLEAGCLPIYYGKGNAIYEDFPANSFLDYSEFNNPEALFEYIDAMTIDEFNDRMNRCIETVNQIASLPDDAQSKTMELQNQNIIDKLKIIFAQELQLSPQHERSPDPCQTSPNGLETPGENLALNKPAQQSSFSKWSKPDDPQRAVNGYKTGSYSFCTSLEDNPWWQVDLQEVRAIQQVRIYNRVDNIDYSERAITLNILLSTDSYEWEQVYVNDRRLVPGGIYGKPLIVSVASQAARYVRIQLNARTYLHLDEVEIYGY